MQTAYRIEGGAWLNPESAVYQRYLKPGFERRAPFPLKFLAEFGYEPHDGGIAWDVCPKHLLAHPIDFPCKLCAAERSEGGLR